MLGDYPETTRRAVGRNLLRNSLGLRRGENVLIETWSGTLPWAESMVLEARILGARPLLVVEDEPTFWKSVAEAPAPHLGHVGSHEWAALKACNAHVFLWGPFDTDRDEALPSSIRHRIEANDHEWFRLVQRAGIRSVRWDLGRTSERMAKRYGVSLEKWRTELIEAAALDPHPMHEAGTRIARLLQRGRTARITHSNGTDLTLRLAGRKPRVDDGVIDEEDVRNGNVVTVVPSGVAGVAVDETFAEGMIQGEGSDGVAFGPNMQVQVPLSGGRWTFRNGRLSDYSFERGEAEFRRVFRAAGPGKERPGIVSVGLNPATTSIPLLFDQESGVISVTVGRNADWGGRTRGSHFVAYLPIRKANLEIDGTPVVRNGELVSGSG